MAKKITELLEETEKLNKENAVHQKQLRSALESIDGFKMVSLSNARKENKGAGIGLLLVKGFLEKNGGKIWAESIEGKGSSFYFTLPAKEPDKLNIQFPDNQDHLSRDQTKPTLQRQV